MSRIRGIVLATFVCGACSSNIITIPSPVPPTPAPVVVVPAPTPTPTPTPTPSVYYTCAERDTEIAAFLSAPHAPLPLVVKLPSGERVYINDNYPTPGSLIHYDGPECVQ